MYLINSKRIVFEAFQVKKYLQAKDISESFVAKRITGNKQVCYNAAFCTNVFYNCILLDDTIIQMATQVLAVLKRFQIGMRLK